ncbi:hypothetical protein U9M48_035637 [Paspalum notatum var. saurae]|uniref:Uncharacterized protein n=1 Tax=Paspalum notatum var. saurae TaxID=547442 RepID=A0AAQ3UC01_PASNO
MCTELSYGGGIHSPREDIGPIADILMLNLLPFLENDSNMLRHTTRQSSSSETRLIYSTHESMRQ